MRGIRSFLFVLILCALTFGYVDSLVQRLNQNFADYATEVDQPLIRGIALIVLIVSVCFAIAPHGDKPQP